MSGAQGPWRLAIAQGALELRQVNTAAAQFHQAVADDADHAPQKAVSGDLKAEAGALFIGQYPAVLQAAYGTMVLVRLQAIGPKVLVFQKRIRPFPHGRQVECLRVIQGA